MSHAGVDILGIHFISDNIIDSIYGKNPPKALIIE
jgi:hypothetical protein